MPNVETITYNFIFEKQPSRSFSFQLDYPSMSLKEFPLENPPEWARLENHKCEDCPLTPEQKAYCPSALAAHQVIESFKTCQSFDNVTMIIQSLGREFRKKVPLQDGLTSLIGLLMAVAGCPVLARLRPMAYTHLPFASLDETLYRSLSMYLLAQYMAYRKGLKPDWELQNFKELYKQIQRVNRDFINRIRGSVEKKDASTNAIITLDCFAASAKMLLENDIGWDELEELFEPHIKFNRQNSVT